MTLTIERIDIFPIRLRLHEPFVVSYATQYDIPTVLLRVTAADGQTGWGEATPDPNVTGETYHSTIAILEHDLAPAVIGLDARDREGIVRAMDARVDAVPAAKAAIDIAVHDLVGKAAGLPLWALLGGRSKPHLTISRVVSIKAPEQMATDAQQHVRNGFETVKLKVGDADNWRLDVARVAAVREAIGPDDRDQDRRQPGLEDAGHRHPGDPPDSRQQPRLHRAAGRPTRHRRPGRGP